MTKEDLIELREVFRKEMNERDFCIGEEKVEEVFRRLLNEPEPEPVVYNNQGDGIRADEIATIFEKTVAKDITKLFERDDTFYRNIKR